MKHASTLLILLILSLPIFAQTYRIELGGEISTSNNLGYKNPDAGFYAKGIVYKSRYAGEGEFKYLPLARKTSPGDGSAFAYSVAGRVYLDRWDFWNENPANYERSKFYLAGGGKWIQQRTSAFKGDVFRAAAGAGYDFSLLQHVEGLYEFKDKSLHRSSAISAEFEQLFPIELGVVSYLVVRPQVALVRYDQDGKIVHGIRAGFQIGVGHAK